MFNIYYPFKGSEDKLKCYENTYSKNPEAYDLIYNYLKDTVLPKYPCLTSVFQDDFDEEGNPQVQYYIRYSADLSLEKWRKLRSDIRKSVFDFCISSGIGEEIYDKIDLFFTVDGDYFEKYGRGF